MEKLNKAPEMINGNLVIVREPLKDKNGRLYKSADGTLYYAYVVKGTVRGKDVKVNFVPKDPGGFEPLDIVFDVSEKAELIMTEEEMTDSNGKKSRYTSYKIQTVDENGLIYSVGVKPQRDSAKSLLQMLLNTIGVQE